MFWPLVFQALCKGPFTGQLARSSGGELGSELADPRWSCSQR